MPLSNNELNQYEALVQRCLDGDTLSEYEANLLYALEQKAGEYDTDTHTANSNFTEGC